MSSKLICFSILMLMLGEAEGQSFSGKTNDILLNFKSPVVTGLPIIKWTTPAMEYSIHLEYKYGSRHW